MRYAATFRLDPDGDVELILRNPNAPFAVWDDSEDAALQDLNACGPELLISTVPIYTPKLEPATPTKGYLSLFKWADRGKDEIQEAAFPEDLLDIDNPFEVDGFGEGFPYKFLLSSRHLMLASSVFKKKLSGPWKESLNDQNSNLRHVETTDWDARALLILLAIIHGRTYRVPQNMDLEMLAKIATLVDYYDCQEAVQMYGDIWVERLGKSLPERCSRDLVLTLLVSWVFSNETIFNQITKTAILKGKGPLPTLELPIPQGIVEEIESRRRKAMDMMCTHLQEMILALRIGSMGCDFTCSSILLGALTKQMHECNLWDLSPESAYLGYGIADTAAALRAFRSPVWYNANRHYHGCKLPDEIFAGDCSSFGEVETGILEESFFQPPSWWRRITPKIAWGMCFELDG